CKTCHAEDGHGNDGMAKLLKTTIPPLDGNEVQKMSDADLKKIIVEGKGKMKPVQGLSDAEIDNVIAYVRTLTKEPGCCAATLTKYSPESRVREAGQRPACT